MNYEKLFTDYKIKYSLKVNRGWVNVTCPFCDDHTFNLGFNPEGDYCHCWKCGGHPLDSTLSRLLSIPKHDLDSVLKEYQGRTGLLYRLNDKKEAKAIKLELPTDGFTLAERKYLKGRNYSPRILKDKYRIVGGGISGPWKYRIIIPLILGGRIVSWTARSILQKETIKELKIPRYKNLSIEQSVINPKNVLYNLDNCTKKSVILTEGAFDVIRMGDDTMCSFGTTLTQAQISEIKNRFNKVFILFDNEIEAQKKARKFGLQLSSIGLDVEIVDAYSDFNKNDGGELTEKEVKIIKKELFF